MISDDPICKVAIPSEYLQADNKLLSDCSKQLRFVHRNKAKLKGFTIKYEYRNCFNTLIPRYRAGFGCTKIDAYLYYGCIEQELKNNFKKVKRLVIKEAKTLIKQVYKYRKRKLKATLDFHLITMVYELAECRNLSELDLTLWKLADYYNECKFCRLIQSIQDKVIRKLTFDDCLRMILG